MLRRDRSQGDLAATNSRLSPKPESGAVLAGLRPRRPVTVGCAALVELHNAPLIALEHFPLVLGLVRVTGSHQMYQVYRRLDRQGHRSASEDDCQCDEPFCQGFKSVRSDTKMLQLVGGSQGDLLEGHLQSPPEPSPRSWTGRGYVGDHSLRQQLGTPVSSVQPLCAFVREPFPRTHPSGLIP